MGRTPRLSNFNGQPGREHWPAAMSILMAGGGMPMGQVIGSTTSKGEEPKDRRIHPCDVLATWYRFPSVTARIFVRYRRPVPINTELLIRAWLTEARGRRIHVDAAITDGDERLAECRAALLHVPLEHFLQTPEGRAAAERLRGA